MKIKKLHQFSGIIITIFVVSHLLNHLVSVSGIRNHIDLMNDLRVVYRNPIAETILLLAVGLQIISGFKLFLRKRKIAVNFFEKLQIWSGLYLAIFLIIHLGAVFSGRFILNLDTNFYFGVAGLNSFPLNLFFIPYYGLAIISFFGHIASVHSLKMKKEIVGITPFNQAVIILIIGILLALVTLYGLTNGFNWFEIPKEFEIVSRK